MDTASPATFAAPNYSMPAAILGSDRATASVSTSVQLGRGIAGRTTRCSHASVEP